MIEKLKAVVTYVKALLTFWSKGLKPLVQGVLCGLAGLMIFVLAFSRLGASVEWVTSNAYLGTIVFGGAIIIYTSMGREK